MQKKALVTGVNGQDGSYLSELLLEKGYEVVGMIRRSSSVNTNRIQHLLVRHADSFSLMEGDLGDSLNVKQIVDKTRPDEIYNLAAMRHVQSSFEMPEYTAQVDALGPLRLLEAMRTYCPKARFYQASTSELFGKVQQIPQSESTPFYPRSPYGVAKLYAYWAVVNFRESYGLYACNGILFNHEGPRRGENFVSRKISLAVARIKLGLQKTVVLGNLDAKRDWGYAKDFVEGMWLMLQQSKPQDYVLATGETHSVREFVELAFKEAGISIRWEGKGIEEKGVNAATSEVVIEISAQFFRPAEVDILLGDASKAKKELQWNPHTTFKDLVSLMVQADLDFIQNSQRNMELHSDFAVL